MNANATPINPFSRLHLNKKYYYGPKHVLYMALDAVGSPHPASLEVVGLPGMGKTSLLRFLNNPENLVKHKEKFAEPFQSDPSKLLPVLVEFQYWHGDINPIQYIYNQLMDSIRHARLLEEKELAEKSESGATSLGEPISRPSSGTPATIVSVLIQQLRSLYAHDIRPIFLIDDIDAMLQQLQQKTEETNLEYPFKPEVVTQLRAWRSSSSFIVCTENKLADIDSLASSNLFGLFDPVYLEGLNDPEARTLLDAPIYENPGAKSFPEEDVNNLLKQAGTHPYLLILGGKLLWEVRERYSLINKGEALSIDLKNLLTENLYENAERRFRIYWGKTSQAEQRMINNVLNQEIPSADNLLLQKILNTGLLKLDSSGNPVLFSTLFERFVRNETNSLGRNEISPAETERKLFNYLEKNRGRACSFAEIAQKVWSLPPDYDPKKMKQRVQVLVYRLNSRLDKKGLSIKIRNLWNSGYELVDEVNFHGH